MHKAKNELSTPKPPLYYYDYVYIENIRRRQGRTSTPWAPGLDGAGVLDGREAVGAQSEQRDAEKRSGVA